MASNANAKVSAYRRRLRDQGLRPVQLWVPDLRDPEIRRQLEEEARRVRGHPSSAEGEAFVDAALADLADELEERERGRD
jgi:hypothetical protein